MPDRTLPHWKCDQTSKNPFRRYPQPQNAVDDRPWWRQVFSYADGHAHEYLLRVDGRDIYEHRIDVEEMKGWDDLVEYDREHPIPVPEPRCGQVWVRPDWSLSEYILEAVCIAVIRSGSCIVSAQMGSGFAEQGYSYPDGWPPKGAVLVAGPLSPWAPPDWEPPKGGK